MTAGTASSLATRLMRRARQGARLALFVLRRFDQDRAARIAASLSYTSLLALVPMLAIALAMLAAFPVFDDVRAQIQQLAFEYLVPQIGEAMRQQVTRFIANAGQLTAVGIVGLAVTAIMLLVTIESALNVIFRVEKDRPMVSRLVMYWTTLTLGPLLIGASFSLQGYLTAITRWGQAEGIGDAAWLATPLATLLTVLAFATLYTTVPNRRVRVLDALAGGVAAGLLFALLRWLFGFYVTNADAYRTIYGAVAAVPIFLTWMFLSWAVVLMGAELTAALPEWRAGLRGIGQRIPARRRLALAMEILSLLHAAAQRGGGGITRRTLLDHVRVAEGPMLEVLESLLRHGYVAKTANHRFILCRDLAAATLLDLVEALDLGFDLDPDFARGRPWWPRTEERIRAAQRAQRDALAVPLRRLVAHHPPDETEAVATEEEATAEDED